jgi:hypothetical protein
MNHRNYGMIFLNIKKQLSAFLLLFICTVFHAHSQNTVMLKGLLLEAFTNKAVANACIYLKSNNSGTSSNASGAFLLKIKSNKPDTLIVSHLSYQAKKIPLPLVNEPLTIFLQKGIFTLPEVNIADDDFVKSIVRNAYQNIKNHFRNQEAIIGATYNEQIIQTLKDSNKTRVLQADVFIEDPGYEKIGFNVMSPKENVHVQSITRSTDDLEITKTPASKTHNRLKFLIWHNPIRYKADFWDTDNNKYNYKLANVIKKDSGDNNIFVIDFETKPEVKAYEKGTMYIKQKTFYIEEISTSDYDNESKQGFYLEKIDDSTYFQLTGIGKFTISFRNTSYGSDIAFIEAESIIKRVVNNKIKYCFIERNRVEYNDFYSGEEIKNFDLSKMKPNKDMYQQKK